MLDATNFTVSLHLLCFGLLKSAFSDYTILYLPLPIGAMSTGATAIESEGTSITDTELEEEDETQPSAKPSAKPSATPSSKPSSSAAEDAVCISSEDDDDYSRIALLRAMKRNPGSF